MGPSTIYGHSTTRVGNKFFLIGGFNGKDQLDDSLAKNKIYQISVIDDDTGSLPFNLNLHFQFE
jgi:hypothetical protein